MYTTSYIRKKGEFYHLVFEWSVNGKKKSKSVSTKSSDERLAKSLLPTFVADCMKVFNLEEAPKKEEKNDILNEVKKINILDKEIRFIDFIYSYVKMKYKTVADNTYSSYYRIMINSLLPYFFKENKKLVEITVYDIEKYYFHEMNFRNISPNTISKYHTLLGMIFKQAMKLDLISKNPMFFVNKPKLNRYIANTYSASEIQELLKLLKNNLDYRIIYCACLIASYLGLRREEILGIKWSSIDFENKILVIKSTVTETTLDGKTVMLKRNTTKTSKSDLRSFIIPEVLVEMFLEMKETIEENMEKNKHFYIQENIDYVFVNEIGEIIKPNYITTKFGKIIRQHKLKKIRFYDLRHSCATLLLENNSNIKEVQAYLGHSSAKTTLDTYVHIINRNNSNSVDKITQLLK